MAAFRIGFLCGRRGFDESCVILCGLPEWLGPDRYKVGSVNAPLPLGPIRQARSKRSTARGARGDYALRAMLTAKIPARCGPGYAIDSGPDDT